MLIVAIGGLALCFPACSTFLHIAMFSVACSTHVYSAGVSLAAFGPVVSTCTFFQRYSRMARSSMELAARSRETDDWRKSYFEVDEWSRPEADVEADEWRREAYFEELQRNRQLRSLLTGTDTECKAEDDDDDTCDLSDICGADWSSSYEAVAKCNEAVEERMGSVEEVFFSEDKAAFRVQVEHGQPEVSVTLMPFCGHGSAFYAVRSHSPLRGLRLEKSEKGPLRGAWVVRAVTPELDGAKSEVIVGDVLQAVSVIGDDGGNVRQALIDVCFIDTLDRLKEAMQRHASRGSGGETVLVFERDLDLRQPPREPLLRHQRQ